MNEGIYPLGIQGFKELRDRKCIYADKTALAYRLANTNKYYFLSRPRRFGKSLLVSTLDEYFSGHKNPFEGLAIYDLQPREWPAYPVIHFDLSGQDYTVAGNLEIKLNELLAGYEKIYGVNDTQITPGQRFGGLIDRAHDKTGKQVVVLVDEYEAPIINCLKNPELEKRNRAVLKGFYGILKSRDERLRFVLITGVGKLGHLSVFSDLNNLRDITLNPVYSTICGIYKEELHKYFDKGIQVLSEEMGWTKEEGYENLRRQYDGYHFARNLKDVYNPFSLLNCLSDKVISDYWFQTGTPIHLFEVLKRSNMDFSTLDGRTVSESTLTGADVIQYNPVPFMFYTGYLTIKKYDQRFNTYTLGYPNLEVENGFVKCLLPLVTSLQSDTTDNFVTQCVQLIEEGHLDEFLKAMQTFFARIPYDLEIRNEFFYHNVMYCVATLLGYYVQAEYHTSDGRIDMVLGTADTVYIMEFKLDGSANEAMDQIDHKRYALGFALDGRRVVKVAINFSSKTRTIADWKIVS